jgi:hypothetical protein
MDHISTFWLLFCGLIIGFGLGILVAGGGVVCQ